MSNRTNQIAERAKRIFWRGDSWETCKSNFEDWLDEQPEFTLFHSSAADSPCVVELSEKLTAMRPEERMHVGMKNIVIQIVKKHENIVYAAVTEAINRLRGDA